MRRESEAELERDRPGGLPSDLVRECDAGLGTGVDEFEPVAVKCELLRVFARGTKRHMPATAVHFPSRQKTLLAFPTIWLGGHEEVIEQIAGRHIADKRLPRGFRRIRGRRWRTVALPRGTHQQPRPHDQRPPSVDVDPVSWPAVAVHDSYHLIALPHPKFIWCTLGPSCDSLPPLRGKGIRIPILLARVARTTASR